MLLKIKLHNIKLKILKVYTTYKCKFCIFGITKLLSTQNKRNLLLIIIKLEKTLLYLNIIYLLLKHVY